MDRLADVSEGPVRIPPDFPVVGVVGGGQLARMAHQAGIALGIRLRVLAESADDSAALAAPEVVVGDHRDLHALRAFAAGCDVLTFDHEHVPTEHLRTLVAEGVTLYPGPDALVHAQDKGEMRRRLDAIGVPCPPWLLLPAERVAAVEAVEAFAAEHGWPVVLKATRGGYDGKGVWVVADAAEAAEVESALPDGARLLAEQHVPFTRELAALVARSPSGQAVAYPVVETVQVGGVCREVIAPAPIADDHATAAQQAALRIAEALGVVGVMAVELFDTPAGVLVNELAMRPHNSGHWTIDGAVTSQFENHLRAVLDLPLGSPRSVAPAAAMANVLGGDLPDLYPGFLHCMARDPGARIHVYGKQVRPGRKVGHVTVVGDDPVDCLATGQARGGLSGGRDR